MTISVLTVRKQYTGDGTEAALPTEFVFNLSTDIVVTSQVIATGVETVLVENTHYTVAGGSYATGTVTVIDGAADFPSEVIWTLERRTPNTQPTDWVEGDDFSAASHEQAADKLTLLTQEREDELNRCLKYPVTEPVTRSSELPNKVDRASSYAGYDSDGEPVALSAPTDTSITTTFSESLLDDGDAPTARATLGAQEDVITARGEIVRGDASGDAEAQAVARGEILVGDSAGDVAPLAIGTSGKVLTSDGTDAAWATPARSYRNALINGCFRVAQRGATFDATTTPLNSDDTFLLDRWILLSDGNDIADVSQETTAANTPTGAYAAIKFDTETIEKKYGILQVIEAKDAAALIGGVVSLSFQARTENLEVENIRAAILAWDGAADTVTSDVITAWPAEDADPTWAANWTLENTPANLALTNSYQTFTIENVSIDTSGATNVAVFIWVDDADLALEDVWWVGNVQLELSALATTFEHRPFAVEIELCQRFYSKTYNHNVDPATVTTVGSIFVAIAGAGNPAAGDLYINWNMPTRMRTTPATVTTYAPGTGNSGNGTGSVSGDIACALHAGHAGEANIVINVTGDPPANDDISVHVVAEAEM